MMDDKGANLPMSEVAACFTSPQLQKADREAKEFVTALEKDGVLAAVFLMEPGDGESYTACQVAEKLRHDGVLGEQFNRFMLMRIFSYLQHELGEQRAWFELASIFLLAKEARFNETSG